MRVAGATIRDAVLGDMPMLREVFRRASLSNDGDRPHLLAHPEVLEYSDEWVRVGLTRAAVIDGQLVGFVTGVLQGDVIEVEDLFVDPEFMRQGVATALVRDMIACAAHDGIPRIEVTGNVHARAFYESVGFECGEVVATLPGSGVTDAARRRAGRHRRSAHLVDLIAEVDAGAVPGEDQRAVVGLERGAHVERAGADTSRCAGGFSPWLRCRLRRGGGGPRRACAG